MFLWYTLGRFSRSFHSLSVFSSATTVTKRQAVFQELFHSRSTANRLSILLWITLQQTDDGQAIISFMTGGSREENVLPLQPLLQRLLFSNKWRLSVNDFLSFSSGYKVISISSLLPLDSINYIFIRAAHKLWTNKRLSFAARTNTSPDQEEESVVKVWL